MPTSAAPDLDLLVLNVLFKKEGKRKKKKRNYLENPRGSRTQSRKQCHFLTQELN